MTTVAIRKPKPVAQDSPSAVAYPVRVPDGEYLAFCSHVHHDRQSRNYGERVYLDFQLWDCEDAGKTIRMFLRPSVFPTSNFYRSWAIARGGPPRSRNTKMSSRVFVGKLFRILTTTVKPPNRIAGPDGKMRPGPFLPESFWYSKVSCILALEVTNEKIVPISNLNTNPGGGLCPPAPPVILTNFSSNPFPDSGLSEGEVGRRELGVGSMRESGEFAVRDENQHDAPPPAGKEENSLPASSPQAHGDIEQQKKILRERGFLQ